MENRCKYANKVCKSEIPTCKKCETYKIYLENTNYIQTYHR